MDSDNDCPVFLRTPLVSSKKRKRSRAVQACERCRTKKYKCDEIYPACSHCTKANARCQYSRDIRLHGTAVDMGYVRALEERVEALAARLGSLETGTATLPDQANLTPMVCSTPAVTAHAADTASQSNTPATSTRISLQATGQGDDGSVQLFTPDSRNPDSNQCAARLQAPLSGLPTSVSSRGTTDDRGNGPATHSEIPEATKGDNIHGHQHYNYDDPDETTDSPRKSEITDVNPYTNEVEFHGNTSSMAFLGDLERLSCNAHQPADGRTGGIRGDENRPAEPRPSLVSALHNGAFPPQLYQPPTSSVAASLAQLKQHRFYATQAHIFIESYFSGIHLTSPIIDKEKFLARASSLWFDDAASPSPSFLAMYLSLLSVGALTRSWSEDALGGLTRFEWSRKLFNEAMVYLNELQFSNDLETVYCLFLMAKVCQNELTPHLAWVFLGRLVRTCISAGFNRNITHQNPRLSQQLSRTWWGIYSLEVEMSFSLGRPDTLGHDAYHNRPLPERDQSEYAIIPYMVDFALIVRKVSLFYTATPPRRIEETSHALQLEGELDAWLQSLPSCIRPGFHSGSLRQPEWCRKQCRVLEIRYHNVRMGLFRGFIDLYAQNLRHGSDHGQGSDDSTTNKLFECAQKCITSARRTVEIMYETFRDHAYFRTWWYNTTYIMMAAAALLSYIKRVRNIHDGPHPTPSITDLGRLVEMAATVLDAMDESVVARKCAEIVRRHLRETEETDGNTATAAHTECHGGAPQPTQLGAPASRVAAVDNLASLLPQYTSFEAGTPLTGYQILDYSFEDMASLLAGLNDANLLL